MEGLSSEARKKMLCLIRSKGCKRCGGDLSVECDIYGVYIECIQCGATFHQKDYFPVNNGNTEKPGNGDKNKAGDNYLKEEIPKPHPKVFKER
jgi:hypothetical protein